MSVRKSVWYIVIYEKRILEIDLKSFLDDISKKNMAIGILVGNFNIYLRLWPMF